MKAKFAFAFAFAFALVLALAEVFPQAPTPTLSQAPTLSQTPTRTIVLRSGVVARPQIEEYDLKQGDFVVTSPRQVEYFLYGTGPLGQYFPGITSPEPFLLRHQYDDVKVYVSGSLVVVAAPHGASMILMVMDGCLDFSPFFTRIG